MISSNPLLQQLGLNGTRSAKSSTKLLSTLFIGLGGTGNTVIRRTKYEMLQHGYDLPIFQYLVLDTMQYAEEPNLHPHMHLRNGEEYLYIGGYNPNEILSNTTHWPVITKWWGNRAGNKTLVTVDAGAGQMRAVGRMSFFRHFKEIEGQLKRMVFEVLSGNNRDTLLKKNFEVSSEANPVVYIVFSLCGGTGSSLFFDVAYVLRKLFGNVTPTIVGIAMLPNPYLQQINSTPQKERIQANAYASLLELERLHKMALGQAQRASKNAIWDVQYTASFGVTSYELPFDYIYLIDDTAAKGTRYTRDELCALLGQGIFWLSGPTTAIEFWAQAKNLMSNNLAGGGRPDASGQLRFSKYSSLGVSTVAIDWQDLRSQRTLGQLILTSIAATKASKLPLPKWLESATALYNEISQPFLPIELKPTGSFKNILSIQNMLNRFSTDYTTRVTHLTRTTGWLLRREAQIKRAKQELEQALHEALCERGPIAAYQEIENALQKFQAMQNELEQEVSKSAQIGRETRDRYNQVLQFMAPQHPLLAFLTGTGDFLRKLVRGFWSSTASTDRRLKEIAGNAAQLLYQCYLYDFRSIVCNELIESFVKPAIAILEQQQRDVTIARDVIVHWQTQLNDDEQRDKRERAARSQGVFEEVIPIPPAQSDQDQIIHRSSKDIDIVAHEVLQEAFQDGLKSANGTYTALYNAIQNVASSWFSQRGNTERALERLVERDTTTQREQFWRRTECLWNFQQDATQNASADLETITLLGVGENTDELSVKHSIRLLLGTKGEPVTPVNTSFPDELAYIKTVHGLPITLIHGMKEMHQSYQTMAIVKKAPYLHLDNRDDVVEAYDYLAQLDITHENIIEVWEAIAYELERSDKAYADYIRDAVEQYRDYHTLEGNIAQIIQGTDTELLRQFVDEMIRGVDTRGAAAPAAAQIAVQDMLGVLKIRRWKRVADDDWVQQF